MAQRDKQVGFRGEILLCEDNSLNQYVIQARLTSLGFHVALANHGGEGVAMVSERMKKGEKPFDLILMDIYMPVMGGLEAGDALVALGCQTPVVAFTSNTTPAEVEMYAEHGMSDFLRKPIVDDELLSLLHKFFVPVSVQTGSGRADDREAQHRRLLRGFAKRNQTTCEDIHAALAARDRKLAHRLAHTLRGTAGLIGKPALQEAARVVESALAQGRMELEGQMAVLQRELKAVLEELAPFLAEQTESQVPTLDREKAEKVFHELETSLRGSNASCMDFVGALRTIPGTAGLITLVEEYEFEAALENLAQIKKSWEAT